MCPLSNFVEIFDIDVRVNEIVFDKNMWKHAIKSSFYMLWGTLSHYQLLRWNMWYVSMDYYSSPPRIGKLKVDFQLNKQRNVIIQLICVSAQSVTYLIVK